MVPNKPLACAERLRISALGAAEPLDSGGPTPMSPPLSDTCGWRGEPREDDVSAITLKVNGRTHTVDVDPATPLLYVLSDDLELRGPKFGCGLGQCGACTVILKGTAVKSCVTPVRVAAGGEITTLEGLGTPAKPHPLQQAFIEEQAVQCGFCVNGVILTAKAFLDKNPKATETEIEQALAGVLCRCFTHVRMFAAIQRYAKGAAR